VEALRFRHNARLMPFALTFLRDMTVLEETFERVDLVSETDLRVLLETAISSPFSGR